MWLRYALEARDTLELVSVDYRLGLEQLF